MNDPCLSYKVRPSEPGLVRVLAKHGLALVDGVGSQVELLKMARTLMTVTQHRDSGPDGVTTLVDRGADPGSGFTGFSSRALRPHTDRSGVAYPPALLMLSCSQPAVRGGQSLLIDGQAVYDDLAETEPDALRALLASRSVLFGGAGGFLGSIFTERGDGRVLVRLRMDDLARFSPGVNRLLPVLRDKLDRHTIEVDLAAGQGYVLDNHRWLHGRRAFSGHRVVHRIIGNPLPHLGIRSGFRSSAWSSVA
ncbi:TauD/TfdA family dioxygenase [Crossiella sp. CA198]|uniref:TauD/TfdA family dioxygenase n=1 Tax=Crossiella sp. CA198 TaxID=3455607 RepID=UPI003F8D8B81